MKTVILGIAAGIMMDAVEFITVFEKPITVSIQVTVGILTIGLLLRQHVQGFKKPKQ